MEYFHMRNSLSRYEEAARREGEEPAPCQLVPRVAGGDADVHEALPDLGVLGARPLLPLASLLIPERRMC